MPDANSPVASFDQQFEASLAWQKDVLAPGANALAEATYVNSTDAKNSADTAAESAEGADSARDEAVAAAITALNAPGTLATSTTTMTIAQGEPSFQIEAGKDLRAGMFVTIGAPGGQVMYGRIQFYDNATGDIEVFVTYTEGAGTYSQWTVAVSGPPARIPRNKLYYYGGA
ncbi:hypothetical protein [Acidovorax sp.]|uniref:hypothetical protein n=1 Tax=Acidovorax sp. TaxID=1872122 RepID=UPI002ACD7120|nr:hypothetical protein [Acidovorax sp.]MDZ7863388.1 hypothetical protein [Acidovorax sp.]